MAALEHANVCDCLCDISFSPLCVRLFCARVARSVWKDCARLRVLIVRLYDGLLLQLKKDELPCMCAQSHNDLSVSRLSTAARRARHFRQSVHDNSKIS